MSVAFPVREPLTTSKIKTGDDAMEKNSAARSFAQVPNEKNEGDMLQKPTTANNGKAEVSPVHSGDRAARARAPFVKVPCNQLGALLDGPNHFTAYAVHLLAIKHKTGKGPGHALNEKQVRLPFKKKGYRIGRRGFRGGIALMKKRDVLERKQKRRNIWAREQLGAKGDNYVEIDEALLRNNSLLVAFILVVNLSPEPISPADAAVRFGISSATTARQLARAAIKKGAVEHQIVARNRVLLARKGHIFDLVKNVLAKNGIAHSRLDPNTESLNKRTQEERNAGAAATAPAHLNRAIAKKAAKALPTRLVSDDSEWDTWQLPPEWREWALTNCVIMPAEIDTEAMKFVNHWRATAGSRGKKLDWLATWKNWILRDYKRRLVAAAARERGLRPYWWHGREAILPKFEPDFWKHIVELHAQNGNWLVEYLGPGPCDDGCLAPPALMVELRLKERYAKPTGDSGAAQPSFVDRALDQAVAGDASRLVLENLVRPLLIAYQTALRADPTGWARLVSEQVLKVGEPTVEVLTWAADDIARECRWPPTPQLIAAGISAYMAHERATQPLKATVLAMEAEWRNRGVDLPSLMSDPEWSSYVDKGMITKDTLFDYCRLVKQVPGFQPPWCSPEPGETRARGGVNGS